MECLTGSAIIAVPFVMSKLTFCMHSGNKLVMGYSTKSLGVVGAELSLSTNQARF